MLFVVSYNFISKIPCENSHVIRSIPFKLLLAYNGDIHTRHKEPVLEGIVFYNILKGVVVNAAKVEECCRFSRCAISNKAFSLRLNGARKIPKASSDGIYLLCKSLVSLISVKPCLAFTGKCILYGRINGVRAAIRLDKDANLAAMRINMLYFKGMHIISPEKFIKGVQTIIRKVFMIDVIECEVLDCVK